MKASRYPLRLTGGLEPRSTAGSGSSTLLAIPHFIVLLPLWIAFAVVSVVAFFASLFAGRYPKAAGRLQRRCPRYPPFRLDMGRDEPHTDTAPDTVPPTPAPVRA
jgi:hypothetical protein